MISLRRSRELPFTIRVADFVVAHDSSVEAHRPTDLVSIFRLSSRIGFRRASAAVLNSKVAIPSPMASTRHSVDAW